jgi:hypothetical protein
LGRHYPSTFGMAPSYRPKCHTHAMASCTQCDGLMESLSFDKPREYLELAHRLLSAVNDGKLIVTESTCPLQDLFKPEWPANVVEHDFQCSACGRSFQLFADTYLGHAGWGVTGPQTKEPALTPSTSSSKFAVQS